MKMNLPQFKEKLKYLQGRQCDDLFYPNSYDPVKTSVDSVFYGPLTDTQCVNAAVELIDLRSQYSNAEYSYNEALDQINFFGRTDLGPIGGRIGITQKQKYESFKKKNSLATIGYQEQRHLNGWEIHRMASSTSL